MECVPALPGLTSWGHTKEEALRNIHDAAESYVEDMLEAGESIPIEHPASTVPKKLDNPWKGGIDNRRQRCA